MQKQHIIRELRYWEQLSCLVAPIKLEKNQPIKRLDRIYLGDQFPDVYWTRREAECVYSLLKNKKRRSIAQELGLSVRTIDSYMETAKAKLNCHSQRELLDCVSRTDFFKRMQRLSEIV